MKYVIDTNCELSPDLQYFYYLLKEGKIDEANKFETENSPFEGNPIEPYKDKLIRLGYLIDKNTVSKLKKSAIDSVDQLIESLIDDYRKLFQGKKVGAAGDRKSIIRKFKEFFIEYPQFADRDLILSAARRYINSCAKGNFLYLKQADYVIYKREEVGMGNTSLLANMCEEIKAGESSTLNEDNYDVG